MATLYYRPSTVELKDDELPPLDAIETLISKYQYIVKNDETMKQTAPPTFEDLKFDALSAKAEDVQRVSMSLLDYQQQELEKYRAAVHTMGQDIVSLRRTVTNLEGANIELRRDLDHYNDSTKLLESSGDLDGHSKKELAEKFVTLKHNLSRQSKELREYKDRVLVIQNELIKKNDYTKDQKKFTETEAGTQTLKQLHDRSVKVRRLEEVIRKQEKVIDQMEHIINKNANKRANMNQSDVDVTVNDALMAENKRLRAELENMSITSQNSKDNQDRERLDLYMRLEHAEGRIMTLEKQLTIKAHEWGKDRTDMLLKSTTPRPYRNMRSPEDLSPRTHRVHVNPGSERKVKPHITYLPQIYDPTIHS